MRILAAMTILAGGLVLAHPVLAGGDLPETFYGTWIGVGVTADKDLEKHPVTVRDTDLIITRSAEGFRVTWKTLISRGDKPGGPERKEKQTVLDFIPGDTPDAFRVERADPPLDPRAEAWAQIKDGDLVVVLSNTTGKGAKRVGRYVRSVEGHNMRLKYTLAENGEVVRAVDGKLRRLGH